MFCYRDQRAADRKTKTTPKVTDDSKSEALEITLENGEVTLLDETRLITIIKEACEGLEELTHQLSSQRQNDLFFQA